MADRFEQLYHLPQNLYSDASPIILSNGVLSKDSQSGKIVIQLKFHNVSTQIIKAVMVSIVTKDVTGAETEEPCDYQYLDLKVKPGESFGSKKAIIVPDAVSRSFSVKSIKVITEDDSVQDVFIPMTPLPESDSLSSILSDPELLKQYKLSVNDSAAFIPQEAHSLWACSCGEWNSEAFCTQCGAKKENVFSSLDIPALTEAMNSRLEKEKAENKEKELKQKAYEEQRAKKIKRIRITTIIVAIVIACILLLVLWIVPSIKQNIYERSLRNEYLTAEELIQTGQYEEAIDIFKELGDYEDSPDRIKECQYKMADDWLDEGEYEKAIDIFEELGDYEDSQARLSESRYIYAQKLYDESQYEEAIDLFEELGDYEDSQARLSESQYQYAQKLYDESQYEEAKAVFEELGDYKDSSSYVEKILYAGTGGNRVTWMQDQNGLLIISGSGPMDSYQASLYSRAPWYRFYTEIIAVDIENGVTCIGDYAFLLCENLTSITIPDSVKSIGTKAFSGCESLPSIVIPDSVISIGEYAFSDCDSLASVVISDSVSEIEEHTFDTCKSLTSIVIPDSVISIGEYAFMFCTSLTSVTIPNSVTSIEYGAFSHCDNLTDIYYTGSESDWGNVNIEGFNDPLSNATIHYNSAPSVE